LHRWNCHVSIYFWTKWRRLFPWILIVIHHHCKYQYSVRQLYILIEYSCSRKTIKNYPHRILLPVDHTSCHGQFSNYLLTWLRGVTELLIIAKYTNPVLLFKTLRTNSVQVVYCITDHWFDLMTPLFDLSLYFPSLRWNHDLASESRRWLFLDADFFNDELY